MWQRAISGSGGGGGDVSFASIIVGKQGTASNYAACGFTNNSDVFGLPDGASSQPSTNTMTITIKESGNYRVFGERAARSSGNTITVTIAGVTKALSITSGQETYTEVLSLSANDTATVTVTSGSAFASCTLSIIKI